MMTTESRLGSFLPWLPWRLNPGLLGLGLDLRVVAQRLRDVQYRQLGRVIRCWALQINVTFRVRIVPVDARVTVKV